MDSQGPATQEPDSEEDLEIDLSDNDLDTATGRDEETVVAAAGDSEPDGDRMNAGRDSAQEPEALGEEGTDLAAREDEAAEGAGGGGDEPQTQAESLLASEEEPASWERNDVDEEMDVIVSEGEEEAAAAASLVEKGTPEHGTGGELDGPLDGASNPGYTSNVTTSITIEGKVLEGP